MMTPLPGSKQQSPFKRNHLGIVNPLNGWFLKSLEGNRIEIKRVESEHASQKRTGFRGEEAGMAQTGEASTTKGAARPNKSHIFAMGTRLMILCLENIFVRFILYLSCNSR